MRKLILIALLCAGCTKEAVKPTTKAQTIMEAKDSRDKGGHGGLMDAVTPPQPQNAVECKKCACNPAYCPVGTAD